MWTSSKHVKSSRSTSCPSGCRWIRNRECEPCRSPTQKRPHQGRFLVWPARRDELRLRLAGLAATATRLELRSSNPLDHPHTKTPPSGGAFLYGPPGEIRTPDTQVRSLVLYPAELRAEARSLGLQRKKVKALSPSLPNTRAPLSYRGTSQIASHRLLLKLKVIAEHHLHRICQGLHRMC